MTELHSTNVGFFFFLFGDFYASSDHFSPWYFKYLELYYIFYFLPFNDDWNAIQPYEIMLAFDFFSTLNLNLIDRNSTLKLSS